MSPHVTTIIIGKKVLYYLSKQVVTCGDMFQNALFTGVNINIIW